MPACRSVFLEIHDDPSGAGSVLPHVDGLVAISEGLRAHVLVAQPGLAERIWVEHDGVDLDLFQSSGVSKDAARSSLGIGPFDGPLVVFTGRAIAGKGVDIVIASARRLAEVGGHIAIVGKVYEPKYLQHGQPNVILGGFIAPSDVPMWQAAADVLVMPTTSDLAYASFTSPLKLFEYMASGRPVVSSDLPVLREVLRHESNALLYPSNEPRALAAAVVRLWSNPRLRERLADQAAQDVGYYSWPERAQRILSRIATTPALYENSSD